MNKKFSLRRTLFWLVLVAMSTLVACTTNASETDWDAGGDSAQEASQTAAPPPTPSGLPTEPPATPAQADSMAIKIPDDFVLIKEGIFNMGSPDSETWRGEDETLHSVTVSDFYMSKYEVTQEEYQRMMGTNPSTFSGGKLPVENITWFDAIAYCNARSIQEGLTPVYLIDGQNVSWNRGANGYRLPTESEWEYASRAGTTTPFNTQTSISAEEANYFGHYPYDIEENYFSQGNLETKPGEYRQITIPVGSFSPNAWGLYDMHGNVGEWCWDYYGPYGSQTQSDPTGPTSGTLRIYRGGGWNDFAKHLRSAYRAAMPAKNSSYNLGFRLVLGATAASENVTATIKEDKPVSGNGKILIVYFTWSGNTRGIANQIKEMTGAAIFEIQLVQPYSTDYNTVLDEAQRDQNRQARPQLANHVENMEQYETVILGYPNWWASIPMPIASFLEEYDFAGKTIIPFCSNGGGGFGQSLTAIAKLAPNATLAEGLAVNYSGGPNLHGEISAWLARNGIIK